MKKFIRIFFIFKKYLLKILIIMIKLKCYKMIRNYSKKILKLEAFYKKKIREIKIDLNIMLFSQVSLI